MTDGESLQRQPPPARLALYVALGEAAGDGASGFCEFAGAVHAQAWRRAAELAAAKALPLSPAARDILLWLGGDRLAGPAGPTGDLLADLMRIGARLRDGDDACPDVLAEFLPSRSLEGWLQEAHAGLSPDNVYPFVD